MKATNEAAEDRKFMQERAERTAKNVEELTEASRLLAEARAKAFTALCDLDREEANHLERVKDFNVNADALADVLAGALSYAFLLEATYKRPEASAKK